MKKDEITILIVDDDEGHVELIEKNLKRGGITNEIISFYDGTDVLNFLFRKGKGPHRKKKNGYLLLLDIRMPKVDGVEVLMRIKEDEELRHMPVLMLTTTDDPREVRKCHKLGCSHYITKPVKYTDFVEVVRQLGIFINLVQIPEIDGE